MDQTRIGDRTARQTLILLDVEINSLNHSKLPDRAIPPRGGGEDVATLSRHGPGLRD